LIALICEFLEDLGPKQQAHFLEYIEMGLPPVVAESMGLADPADLIASPDSHGALFN
jgi:hypothetical protein